MFRGTSRMHERGLVAVGVWILLALVLWIFAWIIAEGIPVFNDLLGLIVRPQPEPRLVCRLG